MIHPKTLWKSRQGKVAVVWAWNDLYIGAYYNRSVRIWCICIIPTVCIIILV